MSGPRSESGDRPGPRRKPLGHLANAADDLVEHVLVDEQPGSGHAVLTLQEERTACGARNHAFQVGVREHHHRRLAAELQRDPLQIAGGRKEYLLADLGGAGERDLVDAFVGGKRSAGGMAVAWHDVDDAVRYAHLLD